jgi:hypothetical protein
MADVGEFLHEVVDDWWHRGPLAALHALVGEVWRANVARYEPEARGDDAQSLGVQSARNIFNLAARRCAGLAGVAVRGGATLEVAFAGRVLHVGKATAEQSGSWDVWSIDWLGSEVRDRAAELNTEAYLPFGGTLLDGLLPDVGSPAALSHLHLAWQGFVAEASTRSWVGFPRAGPRPWFAVLPLTTAGPVALQGSEVVRSAG